MKSRFFLATAAVIALICTQSLIAADKAAKEFEAKCPVSNQPAKADKTATFKGKDVQFCCENCPKKFTADSDKYASKAIHQMVGTGEMKQVSCPFTGKPIDPAATVEIDGVEVAFCCRNCKAKAEKAADKVATVFTASAKGFTVQTKCPVSDKPIDEAQSTDYQGEKVYFCCDKCPAAFDKDPSKFAAKLPQLKK